MANIEISTLTRNNDGNTYIIKDANAITKSGANDISGDLIPATDNSIDIGSSTKNLKMLYTKGITIDGKTIDTDANGNMTYDSHIVDTIEEQGDGYIRYSNGLQICYGNVVNTNNIAAGTSRYSYPVAFSAIPNVVATPDVSSQIGPHFVTVVAESETNFIVYMWWPSASGPALTRNPIKANYVAIGKWK